MNSWHTKEVDELFEAILLLENKDECCEFFADACTIKEILDIAQRLQVAKMLRAGKSYAAISAEVGVSTATISRVSRCLEYGSSGYNKVLKRLEEKK